MYHGLQNVHVFDNYRDEFNSCKNIQLLCNPTRELAGWLALSCWLLARLLSHFLINCTRLSTHCTFFLINSISCTFVRINYVGCWYVWHWQYDLANYMLNDCVTTGDIELKEMWLLIFEQIVYLSLGTCVKSTERLISDRSISRQMYMRIQCDLLSFNEWKVKFHYFLAYLDS